MQGQIDLIHTILIDLKKEKVKKTKNKKHTIKRANSDHTCNKKNNYNISIIKKILNKGQINLQDLINKKSFK